MEITWNNPIQLGYNPYKLPGSSSRSLQKVKHWARTFAGFILALSLSMILCLFNVYSTSVGFIIAYLGFDSIIGSLSVYVYINSCTFILFRASSAYEQIIYMTLCNALFSCLSILENCLLGYYQLPSLQNKRIKFQVCILNKMIQYAVQDPLREFEVPIQGIQGCRKILSCGGRACTRHHHLPDEVFRTLCHLRRDLQEKTRPNEIDLASVFKILSVCQAMIATRKKMDK